MADSTLAVERHGDVVWCALDRPPLNLFEPGLIAALRATFETLARDAAIRAAVVTGRGRAFTAGMDVRVLHCLGAGFELALACDLRVAASNASFGLPEVRVGVPSVIQAALLPPLIGPGRAAEMLLLGTPVDATRALGWGLVNRVVEPGALAAAVDETLAMLLACAPGAVRAQKALMIRLRETDLPSAVRAGIDAFAACYAGDEPREGAAAFLEKRAPRFGARGR